MVGVVFHWDHKVGLEAAGRRLMLQTFDYTCRAFKVGRVVMVNNEGRIEDPLPAGLDVVGSLGAALELFEPQVVSVFLARQAAASSLKHYHHPESAVYVVGGDYGTLEVPPGADCVEVEYPGTEMELWATVVLGLVLYDRSVKGV